MEANLIEIQNLITQEFRGNQAWFAEEIGINESYLSEILCKKKSCRSNKLCISIISFCERTKRDYKKYIIFLQ